jgi:hypothetical protein
MGIGAAGDDGSVRSKGSSATADGDTGSAGLVPLQADTTSAKRRSDRIFMAISL